MSYLDESFGASIDGVPFLVQGHTTSFGRKTAIYRLPFESRGVAHRDMGRAPREFSIEALLIEDDRLPGNTLRVQRDALVRVLEAPGRKLLVHPIYGRVYVVVEDRIQLVESTEMGGCIRMSFVGVEARDEIAQTTPRPDSKANAITKATKLRTAAGVAFEKNFSLDVPDFVTASNLAVLDNIIDGLTDINAIIGQALAVPAHYAAQIARIANQTVDLLNSPQLLYNTVDATFASVIQSLGQVAGRARRGIGNLDEVAGLAAVLGALTEEPADIDTPDRDQERINRANLLIAMRSSALASATEAAANSTFDSANDARAVLQTIQDALASVSDLAITGVEPDVEVFDALSDLSAAIAVHLGEVAGTLAEVTTYVTADTMPMITIAYALYGDASRFEELLARNPQVVHPLMVPGQSELEILAP